MKAGQPNAVAVPGLCEATERPTREERQLGVWNSIAKTATVFSYQAAEASFQVTVDGRWSFVVGSVA